MPCDGPIRIRRATVDDARGIAEVHVRSWRAAYRRLMPDELLDRLDVGVRERYWRQELALAHGELQPWVAEHDGQIVGFVSAGMTRDDGAPPHTAEIYAIYVDPECWHRGIGGNLLAHTLRDLKKRGFERVTLWVLSSNELARRFYEAKGWTLDGTERVEKLGGFDIPEVRYVREID